MQKALSYFEIQRCCEHEFCRCFDGTFRKQVGNAVAGVLGHPVVYGLACNFSVVCKIHLSQEKQKGRLVQSLGGCCCDILV